MERPSIIFDICPIPSRRICQQSSRVILGFRCPCRSFSSKHPQGGSPLNGKPQCVLRSGDTPLRKNGFILICRARYETIRRVCSGPGKTLGESAVGTSTTKSHLEKVGKNNAQSHSQSGGYPRSRRVRPDVPDGGHPDPCPAWAFRPRPCPQPSCPRRRWAITILRCST